METSSDFWRKCSSCKKSIGFQSSYYICSVSTCNGLRTGYVFCTVTCWERHLPGARHRDAAAIEKNSPSRAAAAAAAAEEAVQQSGPTPSTAQSSAASVPQRFIVKPSGGRLSPSVPNVPREILVVVSKLKDYIRARSEMSTSADVMDFLSDKLRRLCDDAIDRARADGRKTVMERDFQAGE